VQFPNLGSDPTGAGDHPTRKRVEVSVDDPAFGKPIEATVHHASGTWSAPLGALSRGPHTVYARAAMDRSSYSEAASSTFTVVSAASVEWQVVDKNASPVASSWRRAAGLETWSFGFDTATYGSGAKTIVVRLVQDGLETARASARARFR